VPEEFDIEEAVAERYSEAAHARVDELCCPVQYDTRHLEVIPSEILERDYGCGNPTLRLNAGETVLDLGSGGGKLCFIASQIVGPTGAVIGVDMNDEMLALAESHRRAIGDRLGYHNVTFHKGKIQDLDQRREQPMIPDDSVDVVISNCVLNLVRPADRVRLFSGMHRVLRGGGRAVISDIVCTRDVPPHLEADPELWSGCLSGAFREDRFLEAFEQAGFHGTHLLRRDVQPWRVIEGIEFRSATVEAFKGKSGPGLVDEQPAPCCEDDSGCC